MTTLYIHKYTNTQIAMQVPDESKLSLYKGSFMTMRRYQLVEPEDDLKYDDKTWSIAKSQGLIMIYSLFWAHLIDYGSFFKPNLAKGPRTAMYLTVVGIPSAIHAVYCSSRIAKYLDQMDYKYGPKYEEYQQELANKKAKAAGESD